MPEQSLAEWDAKIAPRLGKIGRCVWWINHYADELLHTAQLTPSMPKFLTTAEDELEKAKNKLQDAIKILHEKERKD